MHSDDWANDINSAAYRRPKQPSKVRSRCKNLQVAVQVQKMMYSVNEHVFKKLFVTQCF